jgi:hypothetical protein
MEEVKIVRLITGEDIIGTTIQKDGKTTIKSPYVIYPTATPEAGKSVKFGMFTYIPYAETDEISLEDKNILVVVKPKQDLLASYKQSVSKLITGPGLIT